MINKYFIKNFIHIFIISSVLFCLLTDGIIYFSHVPEHSWGFYFVNYFSYFTVLSNITLGFSSYLLITRPYIHSISFRVLRLNAVVCMLITAIIFNIFLRPSFAPPTLINYILSELSHVMNPLLGTLSYLFFDPKPILNKRIIRIAITPPLLYTAYIFIRGYFTGFYPYYFLNIHKVGVLTACLFVLFGICLFLILSFILGWMEKRLLKSEYERIIDKKF